MWKSNHGNFAACEKSLPPQPPPWADAAKWAACGAVLARGGRPTNDCCFCKSVAGVVDLEHDEQGFATGGTLRRLEHVAASAGVDAWQLWQSVDDVLLREMATEQKHFQRDAAAAEHGGERGGHLSRWATPFTADVGFAADGRAYLYETLLQPSWKGPGFQWTEAADREKLGIYSSLLLAMAPMMLHPAADEHHKRLLAPLDLSTSAREEARLLFAHARLGFNLGLPPRMASAAALCSAGATRRYHRRARRAVCCDAVRAGAAAAWDAGALGERPSGPLGRPDSRSRGARGATLASGQWHAVR